MTRRQALAASLLAVAACDPGVDALPYGSAAEACATCHVDHAAEWGASGHAQSTSSPVFQALLPAVEDAWGGLARETCEGCHAPRHGDDITIGCVSCHGAVGNHAERDGALAIDLAAPLSGPLGVDAVPTDAHSSTQRGFLQSESLCGTCHEVTGPELLVEETLTEHRASPFAGEGCVDCHAPRIERPLTADTPARGSRDHAFVGFDPPWDDTADPLAAEATRALLAEALTLRLDGDELVVTNAAAGHAVPTGVSFLRDLWVEVEVDGATVTLLRIGDQPLRDGDPVALLTDADTVRAGSLAAGEELRVTLPADTRVARLRGRAVRGEVLDALGLSDLALPVHEIAEVAASPP